MTFVDLTIQGFPVHVWQADTQAEQTMGLIGVPHLDDDEGFMLASGDGGIHTSGMLMPIDVVWLDGIGNTVAVDINIPPNVRIPKRSEYVLELQGGWFERHGLKANTQHVTGCNCSPSGPNGQVVGQGLAERGRSRSRSRASAAQMRGIAIPTNAFEQYVGGHHAIKHPVKHKAKPRTIKQRASTAPQPIQTNASLPNVVPRPNLPSMPNVPGLQRVAGPVRDFGDEFKTGWHGNQPHGPGNWQRGGRGEGWGPDPHGWQWGHQQQVGADVDPHLYGMHTPHGPFVQLVGAAGARGSGGGGGGGAARPAASPHGGGGHGHHGGPGHHGGHGHGFHHGHHHDFFFGGSGGWWYPSWPWWNWGYTCDPCNTDCPNYDPTLDCS